ncbi:MAG TPA: hypothetical protein EYG89_05590 [Bacteroidia bacterium]|nr:hypothetical protein [Bacteroidia bacterium]
MKTINYNIALFSYWAIGSGTGQGKGLDSVLLKDDNNLPFIPGKTLKGLLRDAAVECDAKNINLLFGKATDNKDMDDEEAKEEKNADIDNTGILNFNNAYLPKEEYNFLKANPKYINGLYDTKMATRLKNKQTVKGSLRKIEVCIPVTLEASIESDDQLDETQQKTLTDAFNMLRLLGEKRYRGMGRCKLTKNTDSNGNN